MQTAGGVGYKNQRRLYIAARLSTWRLIYLRGNESVKEYQVQIKEVLSMAVTVEAESAAKARGIVEQNWKDGCYVLDASHFKRVVFTVPTSLGHGRQPQ